MTTIWGAGGIPRHVARLRSAHRLNDYMCRNDNRSASRLTLADRFDRLLMRFSESERIDGLWIGVSFAKSKLEANLVLTRLKDALELIRRHDGIRYRRILRDLKGIWAQPHLMGGYTGKYNPRLKICELKLSHILDEQIAVVADTIVHEATHARLMNVGIGYEETLRARVEAVCMRRERVFASRLPDGSMISELARRKLQWCDDPTYWTNDSFDQRHVTIMVEGLKEEGAPQWIIAALMGLRRVIGAIRSRLRRTPPL